MKNIDNTSFGFVLTVGLAFLVLALIVLFIYLLQLQGNRTRTEKYKFVSAKETKRLANASYMLSIGISCFAFYYISQWMGRNVQWFLYFFVAFFAIVIAFAIGYTFWAILKFYYPSVLEKRLDKIRFKPMFSLESGNEMRLLNETEEDKYLTEEMIAEEDAFTADYDVWTDEKTGQIIIEKYDVHYVARMCDRCNFRTLKKVKEEVIAEATYSNPGLMQQKFVCSYCGHHEENEVKIPSRQEENQHINS